MKNDEENNIPIIVYYLKKLKDSTLSTEKQVELYKQAKKTTRTFKDAKLIMGIRDRVYYTIQELLHKKGRTQKTLNPGEPTLAEKRQEWIDSMLINDNLGAQKKSLLFNKISKLHQSAGQKEIK